ncbi:hypothetical protein [Streptomyces sp. WAC00263]|uniref:hypothetical protein n=1 Tax=Streptomyces sp. WAC00263 TaxID=1917422 RepID=UPI0009C8EB05|nr:hypothetical protein [Streptomyces sp. WAC00263]KAF5996644.1 hypothetical protein BOG92_037480 [Streptomyces sp. WAC00263]
MPIEPRSEDSRSLMALVGGRRRLVLLLGKRGVVVVHVLLGDLRVDEHLLILDSVGLHVDVDADELVLESLHSAEQSLAVLLQLRLLGLVGTADLPVDAGDLVRDPLLLQVDAEGAGRRS